jgi:galactokinase
LPDHVIAFAPGRVNLIGEHTDYNEGLALPFAIAAGVRVEARAAVGGRVEAVAVNYDERDVFAVGERAPATGWRAFVRGAVGELERAGVAVGGARLTISGDVPRGAGLGSSAALEVALCLALLGLSGTPAPSHVELAKICSRVENGWVGARTGLLDQLASLAGEQDSALLIDFRSMSIEPVPMRLAGFRLVILDSGERHQNAASGYNVRRAECARACELLGVKSLREATLEAAISLPEPFDARATHVVRENVRVEAAVRALDAGDLPALGRLLNASHASLRDQYEVSTPAVEAAVRKLRDAGAIGARLVGGGFGGHVLGLLTPNATPPPGAIEVRAGTGSWQQAQ